MRASSACPARFTDARKYPSAQPETLFQAGSISKPVAAAAVLAAAQEGELDLDAPINSILTSWTLPENEFTAESDVTPRRLLSHTAGTTVHGFPGYGIDADVPTTVQVLEGTTPTNTPPVRVDFVPGSEHRYSGGGSTVMQLAMSDLAGLPYPELMEQRVFGPIGMTSATVGEAEGMIAGFGVTSYTLALDAMLKILQDSE